MKLVIVGGSRGTGKQLVEQGLAAEYDVTAVVRNAASIELLHKNLKVAEGDVLKTNLSEVISESDAVISALGTDNRAPTTVYSQGVKNILDAMMQTDTRRFLCVSASGLEPGPVWQRAFAKAVLWRMFKEGYSDMVRMETEVRKYALDWTIVRPPRLTDEPVSGQYKVAIDQHLKSGSKLSRADLAHYILTHLNDHETYRRLVEVAH